MSPTGDARRRLAGALSGEELELFTSSGGLTLEAADQMRENVIGVLRVPVGLVEGLVVNGRSLDVPLATEEQGVVAQASTGARLAALGGGFTAVSIGDIMRGQIQVLGVPDPEAASARLMAEKGALLLEANTVSSTRKAVDLTVRTLSSAVGPMMVVELFVDVRDSMGANLVDSMCELIAPHVEAVTGGRVNMRILSNLATERMVRVKAVVPVEGLGGNVAGRIAEACSFAEADPYRAVTHNKGVMNGVVGVLLATGNDTRAVEAGAHAYAALSGRYRPLSSWSVEDGELVGSLEMPMSVGTVGGVVQAHRLARLVLRLLGAEKASDLAVVAGAAGLACNLGALYTLVTGGIRSLKP